MSHTIIIVLLLLLECFQLAVQSKRMRPRWGRSVCSWEQTFVFGSRKGHGGPVDRLVARADDDDGDDTGKLSIAFHRGVGDDHSREQLHFMALHESNQPSEQALSFFSLSLSLTVLLFFSNIAFQTFFLKKRERRARPTIHTHQQSVCVLLSLST